MFNKTLPAFTLLLIVLLCAAMMFPSYEGFATSAGELDKDIAKKPKILVLFFTPSCGYCKDLKPEWEAAEQQMPEVITSVDCTNTEDPEVK
jgi:thiol-disulfide isomerase/thioredoxin